MVDLARTPTRDRTSGSGKQVAIPSDLGSAVVDELVEQLSGALANKSVDQVFADGATTRVVLALFQRDIYVHEVTISNLTANALVDADTDFAIRERADGDQDLAAAGTPTERFFVEGLDAGNFPAGSSRRAGQFEAGVLGTAVTTPFGGFVLPAGSVLYAEVINNEGAGRRLGVTIEYAVADGIRLQPANIQNKVFQRVRNFRRTGRVGLLGR